MKKFSLFALLLALTACSDSPADKAHQYFVTICEKDAAKAQKFDCKCEAKVIDEALDDREMVAFVNFLVFNDAKDTDGVISVKKTPEFKTAFTKILKISENVHEKCKVK